MNITHEELQQIIREELRSVLEEDAQLDQQILSRSDYMRGLLNFIEQNPGTTSEEMFNSDVANAIIPIGIRKRAISLWIKQNKNVLHCLEAPLTPQSTPSLCFLTKPGGRDLAGRGGSDRSIPHQ